MFLTETYAMAAGGASAGSSFPQQLMAFLPFIIIIVIFYFLIIRPQQKRQKDHKLMVDQLKKGDKVVTNAGLYGTILNMDEAKAVIKISEVKGEAVKVEVMKNTIAGKAEA